MRNLIFILFLLLLLVGCSEVEPVTVSKGLECPHGNVNCLEPGQCGLYVDLDSNKICDKSE